jgi:hypothetical protein
MARLPQRYRGGELFRCFPGPEDRHGAVLLRILEGPEHEKVAALMELLVAGPVSGEMRGRFRAHVVGRLIEEHLLHRVSLAGPCWQAGPARRVR